MTDQLSISLRPAKFSRVVGQDIAVRLFQQMVARDYLPRCIMISGPPGVGKTSLARIWAALVNCDSRTQDLEPCGECFHCKSIMAGESSIVVEVESATHRKVEEIDEVRKIVTYHVPAGKRRVVIMDEFHTVSDTAQESLLHVLEANSLDTTFVLTTTDLKGIEEAILSRSFPIALNGISPQDREALIRQYFTDYSVQADDAVVSMVARAPYGLRSIWQLIDKLRLEFGDKPITLEAAQDVLGLATGIRLEAVIAASQRSLSGLLGAAAPIQKSGCTWVTFLDALFAFAEDAVVLHESGELRTSSGVSESFLSAPSWTKADCLAFVRAYFDLANLDWKSGLVRLYSVMNAPAQVAPLPSNTIAEVVIQAPGSPVAATSPARPATALELLNQDPVWALIGRNIGKRVVEVA